MVSVSDAYKAKIYADDRLLSARVDKLDMSDDGTPVYVTFSGSNVVQSIKVKEAVNIGKTITVGSCCTSEIELALVSYDDVLESSDFDGKNAVSLYRIGYQWHTRNGALRCICRIRCQKRDRRKV